MGSELGFGRWPVGVVLKWVGMAKGLVNLSSANPALWAMPGLNWRPLPCQGSALPLRQPPNVLLCRSFSRGGDGIRTRVDGFAGRCLASRPRHRAGWTLT